MYLLLRFLLIILLHEIHPSLAQNDEGFEEFQSSEEAMRDFLNAPDREGNTPFDSPTKEISSFTSEEEASAPASYEKDSAPASYEKAESPATVLRNDTMEQGMAEGDYPIARSVTSKNMTNTAAESDNSVQENEAPPEENRDNEEELQFYAKVYGNKLLPGDIPRNHQELLKSTTEGELEKIENSINERETASVRQFNKSSNYEEPLKAPESDNTPTNTDEGELTKNTQGEDLTEENYEQDKEEGFSPQAASTENASARGQITRGGSSPKIQAYHQTSKTKQKVAKKKRQQTRAKNSEETKANKLTQLRRNKKKGNHNNKIGQKSQSVTQLQHDTVRGNYYETRQPVQITQYATEATKKTAVKPKKQTVFTNQLVYNQRAAVPSLQNRPVIPAVPNANFRYYFAQPQNMQVDKHKANNTLYETKEANTAQGTKKHLIQSLYEASIGNIETSQGTKKQMIFQHKKKTKKSKSKLNKQQKKQNKSAKKNKNKKKNKNTKLATKKENVRKIKECHDYLGCLETWFEKYQLRFTPSLNTVEKLRNFFSDVFKSNFMVSFKKEVGKFVDKLSNLRLINWAVVYEYRPNYASWMNIEFLCMPLGIETPVNLKKSTVFRRILWLKEQQSELKIKIRGLKNKPAIGAAKRVKIKFFQQKHDFFERSLQKLRSNETIVSTYRNEAPALVVSGFERNSQIWLQCAPTREKSNRSPYTSVYQRMMDVNSYQCVIFAFMKCVHDMEEEDKRQLGSFKRYTKGFASLIQLHYDYGADQNKLLPITEKNEFDFEKLTSAYCESDVTVKCLQEDGMTREKSIKFGNKYYCQNYFGCLATCGKNCFLRERNLLPDERNRLMDWLQARKKTRAKAENELWTECCSNPQDCLPLKNTE